MRNILPILLSMKNFTSYIDETIDFTKFNSPAIICGDNGNGKSSIIDAITTALYFRARGTDTRGAGIDDLITKGKKEFTINYVFEMDGQCLCLPAVNLNGFIHEGGCSFAAGATRIGTSAGLNMV